MTASSKSDTNYLVCKLAAVAMNLLRMIGQNTLNGPDSPVRYTVKRRRIRTIMHEMMFKAARMIRHAGRWILGLGESDSGVEVCERQYGQVKTELQNSSSLKTPRGEIHTAHHGWARIILARNLV